MGPADRARAQVPANCPDIETGSCEGCGEVEFFGTWAEVEALAVELGSLLPIIVAGTGLRPQKWIPLERRDVDRENGLLYVRRTYVKNKLKTYGKTTRSLRVLPLRQKVAAALEASLRVWIPSCSSPDSGAAT